MEGSAVQKRPREEIEAQVVKDVDSEECSKRHKPYNHILSLLESEEEESTQDLSPLMTTLQQEITCASSNDQNTPLMSPSQQNGQEISTTTSTTSLEEGSSTPTNCFSAPHALKEDKEDEKESVMRHLLQASDDELGIPNTGEYGSLLDFGEYGFDNRDGDVNGDGFSSLCDKLWELEDEAANYYALLQSELFLWEQ